MKILRCLLLIFLEKCVILQCRAYAVPSEKDARMGGTLHNVKASSMLCFWMYEPRKFIKLIRNIARSECLRVWHNYIPGCVARVLFSLVFFVTRHSVMRGNSNPHPEQVRMGIVCEWNLILSFQVPFTILDINACGNS